MGNFTVNLIFAAIFGGFAWNSLPRGWRFFKTGWLVFRAHADQDDVQTNVERQRTLQGGSTFLVAGLAWLIGGVISAILALAFTLFAFLDIGIFNFLG
ncbi:MAG: hypothetical protein ACFE0Q_14460 [Anaerolineae bacterium]